MAGSYHLALKLGFKLGFLLTSFEETSKSSGENDEYETMKQVGAGK